MRRFGIRQFNRPFRIMVGVRCPLRFIRDHGQNLVVFVSPAFHGIPKRIRLVSVVPVSTMQVDGQTKMAVTCDPLDLLNFIKRDFMPMNLMCDRAEMVERGIYDRSNAVFEHFGLPFDAEPPA